MRPLMEQNYYELLEVAPDAAPPRIDHAYRIARATYQPTSAATYSIFSEEENTAILRRIEEAYAVLADSDLRGEYDQHLAREKRRERRQRGKRSEAKTAPATTTPAPNPAPTAAAAPVAQTAATASAVGEPAPPLRAPAAPDAGGQLELDGLGSESWPESPPVRSEPLAELFHEREHADGTRMVREPAPARARHRAPVRRNDLDLLDEELIDEVLEPADGVYDGRVLKRMRLALGIEVEEIASITKINESYVQSIEDDRYESLPAPVYVRGFVKEIAKVLSLDPKIVADSYMQRMGGHSGRGR